MSSRPAVSDIAEETYEGLTAWARADHDVWDLLLYVDAIVHQLQPIVDLVRDTDTHDGWARLLDVDAAPSEALPWLAQFVGVTPLRGLSDAAQRLRIKEAAGWQRGSVGAIRAAAQQFLTGTRQVEVYERDGSPWQFRIRTYQRETPNPLAVHRAVTALKPAGLVFVHEVQAGVDIDSLGSSIDAYLRSIESFSDTLPTDPDLRVGQPYGSGPYGRGLYGKGAPAQSLGGLFGLVSTRAFGVGRVIPDLIVASGAGLVSTRAFGVGSVVL